ncbi:hypothetical protein [Mycobacterium avium]|uniref:Uncharacterized protein n=1 Tax=Mycobacterium avium subsp. hominissuis TaxID=439334 RepID=A0AAI8X5A4_MYCAV|nr:hypothetical protein [Mycobacterium avium]PBA08560.1 hypothetical protein CKJ70_25715 [Mycobacterium avium]BBN50761.1 hypothetical protein JPH1_52360 [Mycobacterium avium subsp. hominissuis]
MSDIVQAFGLPPARDFLVSPGFAGAAALIAAVIVVCAVLYGSRRAGKRHLADSDQRERHHEERRADEQHAVAVARCWDRWWQVLQTAALEPAASEGATLGLGPEVTLQVLRGLLRDAEQLADDTLVKAITVYQEQLLLVLAQQSGPLSRLATETATSVNGDASASPPRGTPTSIDSPEPGTGPGRRATTPATASPASESDESSTAATEQTSGRRRRR